MGKQNLLNIEKFLSDYFRPDDEISVNCAWLQAQLIELNKIKREIALLKEKNELQSLLLEINQPKYRLDVTV